MHRLFDYCWNNVANCSKGKARKKRRDMMTIIEEKDLFFSFLPKIFGFVEIILYFCDKINNINRNR